MTNHTEINFEGPNVLGASVSHLDFLKSANYRAYRTADSPPTIPYKHWNSYVHPKLISVD